MKLRSVDGVKSVSSYNPQFPEQLDITLEGQVSDYESRKSAKVTYDDTGKQIAQDSIWGVSN
jgi:hypothetical protein